MCLTIPGWGLPATIWISSSDCEGYWPENIRGWSRQSWFPWLIDRHCKTERISPEHCTVLTSSIRWLCFLRCKRLRFIEENDPKLRLISWMSQVSCTLSCMGIIDRFALNYNQGLTISAIRKHQLLAAFWMLWSESSGCPGGFESDEMGYGKVYCLRWVRGRVLTTTFRRSLWYYVPTSAIAFTKLV